MSKVHRLLRSGLQLSTTFMQDGTYHTALVQWMENSSASKSRTTPVGNFFKLQNFHSIVLLAVVDAQYRILVVDTGTNGQESDGGIFSLTTFGKSLESASAGPPEASN